MTRPHLLAALVCVLVAAVCILAAGRVGWCGPKCLIDTNNKRKEIDMKLRLFEYAMLLHPSVDKDGKEEGKTIIIKDLNRVLAKDEKQVGILAAREIPAEHIDALDRVEIIVRPF